MSHFSLLEHMHDEGQIEDPASLQGFQEVTRKSSANALRTGPQTKQSNSRAAAASKGGMVTQQKPSQTANRGQQSAANGLKARPEDYYRAFQHVYKEPGTGNVILRFHKTNIVVIKASGEVVLNTNGWYTYTTWAAMNDALHAINIKVRYQGPVTDGSWAVVDDAGRHRPYHDGIVVPVTKPAHKQRGTAVLKAYAGGAEVPVYAIAKPMPAAAGSGATAASSAGAGAMTSSSAGPAVNFAAVHHHQQQQQQLAALRSPARHVAAQASRKTVHEQLQEAIEELDMQDELEGDDEHVCVVCLHQPREEVLVPCGHMVLCRSCCVEIVSKAGECPVCREMIIDHCTLDGINA